MRSLLAPAFISLILSACLDDEPKLDVSSADAYRKSLAQVEAALPEHLRGRLTPSLMSLVTADVDTENNLFAGLAQLASFAAAPEALLDKLRPLIDGKTGPEVIHIADQRSLQRYERQMAALEGEIAALQQEIEQAEQKRHEAQATLDEVVVEGARYYWSNSDLLPEPVIDVKITNNTSIPISRIFLRGLLETPGRSVPWVDSSLNYLFRGGLEPGETQHLKLAPSFLGDWDNRDLKNRDDLVLTLRVQNIQDADGNDLVSIDEDDIQGKKSRIELLRESQGELAEKLAEINNRLAKTY